MAIEINGRRRGRRGYREESRGEAPDLARVWRMNRLTGDGTTEPASRDQILRRERGQGNIHFPCIADPEQDWQPYMVDPYSAGCDDRKHL